MSKLNESTFERPKIRPVPHECSRGHDLRDPKNCYITPKGKWRCRRCTAYNTHLRQESRVIEKLKSLRTEYGGPETDLAYAAGMFEGEGTITISKAGKYTRTLVSVPNTDFGVPEFYLERWGGRTSTSTPNQGSNHGKNSNAREVKTWRLDAGGCYTFLHQLMPHLRRPLVINRARLAMASYEARRQGTRDQAYSDLHQNLMATMRILNHRGLSGLPVEDRAFLEEARAQILSDTPHQWR